MECKFCHAQMEEDAVLCPVCGRDNTEELPEEAPVEETPVEEAAEEGESAGEAAPEEPAGSPEAPAEDGAPAEAAPAKKKTGKIAAIIAGCTVLALLLAAAVGFFIWNRHIEAGMGTTEITEKDSYTGSGLLAGPRDRVVARMEDKELTAGQLQVFYWMEYHNFVENSSTPVDLPLDENESIVTGYTWQQYFLDSAITTWAQFQGLCIEAEESGFVLEENYQEQLDNMEESHQDIAAENGFDSLDEMVQHDFGATATFQDYKHYMELYYTAYLYFNEAYSQINPTQEELSEYFDANAALFQESGIEKDDTPATIAVRHILISPEGGTQDESGNVTYSEEEWAAAETQAQEVYAQWQDGDRTEDSFAALAEQYSVDPGSNTNGGLYDEVWAGQMVAEFNDWCFDQGRKTGDTGIVRTSYGFHIMYFVSASEETLWETYARYEYVNEKGNELITGAIDRHGLDVNYRAIVLSLPTSETEDVTEPTDTTGENP